MTLFPAWIMELLRVSVVAATVMVVFFIVQYTLTSPWWHDPVGRTVVAKDAALLLLLVPNTVSVFWRYAISPYVTLGLDIAALILVALIMVWRCVVFWRIEAPRSPAAQYRKWRDIHRASR